MQESHSESHDCAAVKTKDKEKKYIQSTWEKKTYSFNGTMVRLAGEFEFSKEIMMYIFNVMEENNCQ